MNFLINIENKMFELIGLISVFLFLIFLLIIQYSMMTFGIVKKDLKLYGYLIGWVPFLPFILMFIFSFYFLIKFAKSELIKWLIGYNK
jgi:hypothetical protein